MYVCACVRKRVYTYVCVCASFMEKSNLCIGFLTGANFGLSKRLLKQKAPGQNGELKRQKSVQIASSWNRLLQKTSKLMIYDSFPHKLSFQAFYLSIGDRIPCYVCL